MSKIILESITIATMNADYQNATQCACFAFCMGPIMEAEFQNERGASQYLHSCLKILFLATFIEASSSSLMDIKKKKTAHCHLSNQRNTLRSRDNCCRKLLFQSCNISTAVSLVGAETWNQNLQMARWVLCHHSTSRSKSFFFFLMSNFTNR